MQFLDDCAEDEDEVSGDEDDGSSVGSFVTSDEEEEEVTRSRGTLKRCRLKRGDYDEKQDARNKQLQREASDLLAHLPEFTKVKRVDVHARRTSDLESRRSGLKKPRARSPVPCEPVRAAPPGLVQQVEKTQLAPPNKPLAPPEKKRCVPDPSKYSCDREFKIQSRKPAPTAAEQWQKLGIGYRKPSAPSCVLDFGPRDLRKGLTTADILNPAISEFDFTKPKDYIP